MKLSNNSIVMMLLGIVVLAGCVGQPAAPGAGAGGTAGVIIKSLQVSPTQAYGGSNVIITADIQNIGAQSASSVTAQIFGLDSWTGDCIPSSSKKTVSDLAGANPSLGVTQGAETFVTWSCTAPSNVQNVIPYTFSARVSYKYKTILDAVLKAVDVNYFRQTNTPGGVTSSSFTSGPLSVTVKAPTVISTSTGVPIQFEITNAGGGRVGDSSDTTGKTLDQITTITASSPLITSGSGACPASAFLGGGTKTIISCNVATNTIPAGGFGNLNLHLELSYNYFVDASQTVTVLPIAGTSATGTTTTSTITTTTVSGGSTITTTTTTVIVTG